jgi:hypothetical protein
VLFISHTQLVAIRFREIEIFFLVACRGPSREPAGVVGCELVDLPGHRRTVSNSVMWCRETSGRIAAPAGSAGSGCGGREVEIMGHSDWCR